MVVSIASRCYKILFILGELHLPHQKAENLASCYLQGYTCLRDLVYQMCLTESLLVDVLVGDGATEE